MKYKVWDTSKEKFIQDDAFVYVDPDGDVFEIDREHRGGHLYKNEITNQVKIIRYTGLKDKAGMEIYEGDIINDSFGNKKGVIRYNVHSAAFEISNYGGIHLLTSGNCDHFFEVIGNVYQDPHLLPKE